MLETKVFSQCRVNDLDSHRHKCPALPANLGFTTASSNLIIVGQINIKNQLLGNRAEAFAHGFPLAWIGRIHRANLETRGLEFANIFSKAVFISSLAEIS